MWSNLVENNYYAWGPDKKKVYLESVRDLITVCWHITVCFFRGHDLFEELVDGESGHSEVCCTRCGWHQDIWM
jgi:hypothetical protein